MGLLGKPHHFWKHPAGFFGSWDLLDSVSVRVLSLKSSFPGDIPSDLGMESVRPSCGFFDGFLGFLLMGEGKQCDLYMINY